MSRLLRVAGAALAAAGLVSAADTDAAKKPSAQAMRRLSAMRMRAEMAKN